MRTFLLALVVALSVIGISGHAHAGGCPTPNPNNNAPPFVDNCSVPAAALNNLFGAGNPVNDPLVGAFNVRLAGAKCDNSTDDHVKINNAIAAIKALGGGAVLIPGFCNVGSSYIDMTSAANVALVGLGPGKSGITATDTGTSDLIKVGPQTFTGAISNPQIKDLTLSAPNRTGGYLIDAWGTSQLFVSNLQVNGWLFMNNEYYNNTVVAFVNGYSNATVGANLNLLNPVSSGQAGEQWTGYSVFINSQSLGSDFLVMDGFTQTISLIFSGGLQTKDCIVSYNTAASSSEYPAFLYTAYVQCDGGTHNAVQLNSGFSMHFLSDDLDTTSGSSQVFVCNPDLSGSNTKQIDITGTNMHDAQQGVAYINCIDVSINGSWIHNGSKASHYSYPALELGTNAARVMQTGGCTGGCMGGDGFFTTPSVLIDSGATVDTPVYMASNVSFYGNNGNSQTTITNNSSGTINIDNSLDTNQQPFEYHVGSPPTVSGCGTTPNGSISSDSTTYAGTVTVGGGSVTSCTIHLSSTLDGQPMKVFVTPTSGAPTSPLYIGTVTTSGIIVNSASDFHGLVFNYEVKR